MEYKMKLKEGNYFGITELENDVQKIELIELSIGVKKDWSDAHVHLSKNELHKLIGTLLHVQAKMK